MQSTDNNQETIDEEEEDVDDDSFPNMTKSKILECCKKHDLYIYPELNDTLYLHYEGFPKIKNLDEFVNLKSLWLNNNQITIIENLSSLKQLTSLNLQNNLITDITGLEDLTNLNSLMLSNNCISKVSGLSNLKNLVTFEIDYNQVKTADLLKGILECPSISVLNIVHNQMDDPEIIEVLSQMPNLKVLRMDCNPIVPHTKSYRRQMTLKCQKLQYLDDAQITDEDRLLVDAWSSGGKKAEMIARQQLKEKKREKEEKDFKDFRKMQRDAMLRAGGNLKDYPELMSSDDEHNKLDDEEPQSNNDIEYPKSAEHVGASDNDIE